MRNRKQLLLDLPIKTISSSLAKTHSDNCVIVFAGYVDSVDEGRGYALDFYSRIGKKYQLNYRYFFFDSARACYNVAAGKFEMASAKKLFSLNNYWSFQLYGFNVFMDSQAEAVVNQALDCIGEGMTAVNKILRLIEQTKNRQRRRRYANEMAEVKSEMGLVSESLPDDINDFIEHDVCNHFYFYKLREKKGLCTSCGARFDDKAFIRPATDKIVCPQCYRSLFAHNVRKGISLRMRRSRKWFQVLQPLNNEKTVIRTYEVYRYIEAADDSGFPRVVFGVPREQFRFVISQGNVRYYTFCSHFRNVPLDEDEWAPLFQRDLNIFGWWSDGPSRVYLYNRNLNSVNVFGLNAVYGDSVSVVDMWTCVKYALLLDKYPAALEKIIKAGMGKLLCNNTLFDRTSIVKINPEGRQLKDVLLLSPEALKRFRQGPLTIGMLKLYQNFFTKYRNVILKFTDKELEWISNRLNIFEKLIEFSSFTGYSVTRFVRYLITHSPLIAQDYIDYIEQIRALNFLVGTHNYFPDDLDAAHKYSTKCYKENIKEINKSKEEAYEKEAAAVEQELLTSTSPHMKEIRRRGYIIKCPTRLSELDKESEVLEHCVNTFKNKLIDKKTRIFFIRKADNAEMPYYTLEYRDEGVFQCRGKRNCGMTDEINDVSILFETYMKTDFPYNNI